MSDQPPVWAAATAAKTGHHPDENEDAIGAHPTAGRFAVADGATEGWKSGAWAKHLVTCYLRRSPEPATFADWFADTRRAWAEPTVATDEPWYAQAKREEGAFATLLGVEFRARSSGPGFRWRAVAVGDSCLFHLRGGELIQAFPVESVEQFGSRPALLPSREAIPVPTPEWLAGTADPGDTLALATDAVAAALLAEPTRLAALPALATRGHTAVLDFLKRLPLDRADDVSLLIRPVPHPEAPR
jgi:hypothetical protein